MRQKPTGALDALLRQENEQRALAPQVTTVAPRVSDPAPVHQIYPSKGPAQVPTESCVPWKYADRGDFEFDHVDQLAESFEKEGQLQPVIVRPYKAPEPSSPLRYEIIAGRARWMGAKKAGKKLDVIVRPMNDEEAYRVMWQENESRRKISDYSRGLSYQAALKGGLFPSARALAQAFKVSDATVSRLLATAALDARIVEAFSSPAAIGQMLGNALRRAEEAGRIDSIVRDAKKIESGEIRLADIPNVWDGEASTVTTPAPDTDVPTGANEVKRKALTQRFLSSKGAPLFVVKTREGENPTVKFQVPVDAEFFEAMKVLVEKQTRRRKP